MYSLKHRLVAHRGDMATYPENSLLALCKAAELGFTHIELDIQVSNDLIPIVIHDDSLKRTAAVDKQVNTLSADEITSYELIYNGEYVENQLNIVTLEQAVDHLNKFSDINLYVEVKNESIENFGLETVMSSVLKAVDDAKFNIVIISFSAEAVQFTQQRSTHCVGWVLRKYNDQYREIAKSIQPDYLYCNVKKIFNPSKLWKGEWKWALYDVKDPKKAKELLEVGVDLIETGDIVRLSNSDYFV